MTKIALVSDTTADIPDHLVEQLDVHLANAFVHFGNEEYIISQLPMSEFYEKMNSVEDENFPKTSQPKANEFLEIYEKLKSEGYDIILSIHVAKDLSGTINSANVAKGMIDEIDIRIFDSHGVSANLLAVVKRARELIDSGLSIDDIIKQLQDFTNSLESFVTIKSMKNLVRGGRISKIRYRFGWLLNIKPILRLANSELAAYKKARGLENARQKMYEIAMEDYDLREDIKYIIAHTREEDTALALEEKLQEEYPNASGIVLEIGIVVAVHAGEGAILLLAYK